MAPFFRWSINGFTSYMQEQDSNFITNKQQILETLSASKEQGRSIGILSNKLGDGMIITGIEDIRFEDDSIFVVLKPFDHTGYILPFSKLAINEIISVCPLNSEFKHPYLDNIEKSRSWFF